MDWAIDSAGDEVRAGTPRAYGYSLRCPVCKASVYHRHGACNRPHFAHYSRNFNQACELYRPGTSGSIGTKGSSPSFSAPPSFESPALIWRDGQSVPLSLQLRLPRVPLGYASVLSVVSSLGRQVFPGDALTRTSFAQLPLEEPPAKIETSPRDPATEMRVEAALSQFRLSGNYFRATATGGVLEDPNATLELGEEYYFVSHRPLAAPYPPALIPTREQRQHRSWMIYRLLLRDDPNTRDGDISDLESYLGRLVTAPKPRIDIIWPPPYRFDADGVPVFTDTTNQLIVRSCARPPNIETVSRAASRSDELGGGLYQVIFDDPMEEAIIWTESGSVQRLRFQAANLNSPDGVVLTSSSATGDLTSLTATEIAGHTGPVEILVPLERLWRNARLDGEKLRPLPSGTTHSFLGPLQSLDFGAFGSVSPPRHKNARDVSVTPWCAKIERLVCASAGTIALAHLRSIRSKHQAVRWAIDYKAMRLLPLVLSALSAEVDRGIS